MKLVRATISSNKNKALLFYDKEAVTFYDQPKSCLLKELSINYLVLFLFENNPIILYNSSLE